MIGKVDEWVDSGVRVALATVVKVERSAPRPPGAKLAVNERGEVWGAVSGGCVEGAVIDVAQQVLRGGEPRLLHFGIADADAWEVGLPCGGEIDVLVEEYRPASTEGRFAAIARADGRAALVTAVPSPGGMAVGTKLLVNADGERSGTLGDLGTDRWAAAAAEELIWAERSELREHRGAPMFVDVTSPAPRLIVFGAVEYAAALCRLARICGWRPYVVDPRARFAARDRFPEAEEVMVAWPEQAFEALGGIDHATSVVVLTHDPKLDDAALTLVLRSPARYVGAMGSRRAQAERRRRLAALGVTDEELERLAAPVGLDLGATSSEETALSIMAEVVAARHGRAGGRLASAGAARIHEVPA